MKVVVVGAGLAGLRTAQLLEKSGHEVALYEAQNRVGGRLHTIPSGTGFYEGGGEWIDSDHTRLISLLNEFGLQPEPTSFYPGIVVSRGEVAPEDQPGDRATADFEGIDKAASALAQRMPKESWFDEDYNRLDRKSLADWLDRQCTSDVGRWFVEAYYRSDEGEDTDQISLLSWLHFYRNYLNREGGEMSAARIPGGSQVLCQSIAATLQSEIQFNQPLKSFDTKDDHVELWFDNEMVFADRAVIAVPPTTLAQIEWPVDQEFRRNQIAQISMARVIKVALQYSVPWWEQSDWPGRLLTDLPCQQVWISGREGANVLCAYICGEEAQIIAASQDPVQRVQNAFAEIFPQSSEYFQGGKLHSWLSDPFAQGAFPFIKPGKFVTAWPGRAEPVENVHFAGDWTAEWFGFMEGALESAERVNREINHE